MNFIAPTEKIKHILCPDKFILWQKTKGFLYACMSDQYHFQIRNQCNFATLWGLIQMKYAGVDGYFCYGEYDDMGHSWIECDGLYYDLTLSQFNSDYPRLCVMEPGQPVFQVIERIPSRDISVPLHKYKMGKWLRNRFEQYHYVDGISKALR